MKVMVTGANGHIGSNTVRALLALGHDVTALIRKSADTRGIDELNLRIVRGDILDAAALAEAVTDCEAIVHLAAVYKVWAKTPDEIMEPAIKGTQAIFEAAANAGVKRIVYTSSMASVGVSDSPEETRNSGDWNNDAKNPYYIAKKESEKIAWDLATAYGIELVVLCPTMVIGPLDYRITPSTDVIRCLANGALPFSFTYQGGTNYVDVRDVANVHALAVDHPSAAGKRFIVGGTNIQAVDFAQAVKEQTGTPFVYVPMSRWAMLNAMKASDWMFKQLKMRPLVPQDLVYENVGRWAWYDCKDTWETFDYSPLPLKTTIKDTLNWLSTIGKIRPLVKQRIVQRAKYFSSAVV